MTTVAFADVYDELYARRDPVAEVGRVHALLASTGTRLHRLLDIGCATGRHAAAWCRLGVQLTGVDVDAVSIARARDRAAGLTPAPEFYVGTVADVAADGFDAATALFHVINYIPDVDTLIATLRCIRSRLAPGAPFVFDAWNGIAVLLDPPRVKDDATVGVGGRRIAMRTTPTLDHMAQVVTLDVNGTVTAPDGTIATFATRYAHRLWMPQDLVEIAKLSGFQLSAILRADGAGPADETCWKVLFLMTSDAKQ